MASFTDNAQALSQFNPYIQQLPVEEMIDVGKRRQAAHNEGVQKIQTEIENVAGLDVVRDVDKAYLQSKLNQLGNNLRTVAAGDFSNFQLVNSVGGMTKQIANDRNIQNSVNSTAKYRKEIANMEAATKEGKSSIANQWVFGKDSSDWLNSPDINASFTTKYQPYVDVQKKWMDVMKTLHSDISEQDLPYERKNDGTIDYTKTAAAMQRLSKETVSADKIANALNSSLTPDELNQLKIDGRYEFRGYGPEALVARSEAKYKGLIGENSEKIKNLQGLIALSASNPKMQKDAQDAIESLKLQNIALNNNRASEVEAIAKDPETAKGLIYQNGAVAQFATANSWEHNKKNLLTNPILEAEHWEKNQALERSKFELSKRKQTWDEYMDKANYDLNTKEYLLKVAKQNADQFGLEGGYEEYGGTSTKIQDPMTSMITEANEHDAAVSAGIVDLVRAMPGTNSVQIKNALLKYQAGDPNWFKLGTDSKSIIPVDLRDKADEIIYNRKAAKRLNTGIKQTIDEVDNSASLKNANNKILAGVKDLPPIVGVDERGRSTTFTQKEIVEFINKRDTSPAMFGGGGLTLGTGTNYTKPLTNREKQLEKHIWGSNRTIFNQYVQKSKVALNDFKDTRDKMIEQNLLEKGGTFIPRQVAISFGSDEGGVKRRTWESTINTALAPYGDRLNAGGVTGGVEELSADEYETAKEWISGKDRDQIIYSKIEQGSKTFVQMTLGGKDILVPVNRNRVNRLPMTDPNAPSPEYKEIVGAQRIGKGNTNPTGKFEDCYFDNTNIKGTRLNIGADLVWNKSNNDKQYISLKLNTPKGMMPLMVETPVDRDKAITIIKSLTDKQIKELYLADPSIPENWKEVIKKL